MDRVTVSSPDGKNETQNETKQNGSVQLSIIAVRKNIYTSSYSQDNNN